MSHPRPHIVNHALPQPTNHSPLQDDDDDDLDDICPVCESECTCPKKSAPTPAPLPSASSTSSSLPSAHPPQTAGKRPLKIKLTLPPNPKSRPKPPATHLPSSSAHLGPVPGPSKAASTTAPAASAPKRRGRPPKALSAKCNTKKKAAADDMEYRARGTTGTAAHVRRAYQPPAPAAGSSAADLSDSTLSDYPTFVPAAGDSTHSSSSESSDSSIDSESDDDEHPVVRNDDVRQGTKLLPSHVGHRKREKGGGNGWEIRPRKKSVGAGEEEEESSDSSDLSDESSEDGDDEDEEEEEDEEEVEAGTDADIEGGDIVEPDVDLDLDEERPTGRIGITFPGTGWSDDEDESFDADLFFANLDSDSGGSSPEPHFATFPGETSFVSNFSADEEDALLLMDIDSSVQLRRRDGEFEIGVDLGNLSFGWDRQLFMANDGLGLPFDVHALPNEDAEMASYSGSEATASWDAGTVILQESDGDTTEDELVDSDGLPNPRAMMLFRWPTTISAINPLSTLSPSGGRDPPAGASPSTRIALASMSSQRGSPPPTPSPADILAGRVSMDDLEDIEMEKIEKKAAPHLRRRRGSGIPIMGEFAVEDVHARMRTAVVGDGSDVPSFYPRPVRIPKSIEHVPEAGAISQSEVSLASLSITVRTLTLCVRSGACHDHIEPARYHTVIGRHAGPVPILRFRYVDRGYRAR